MKRGMGSRLYKGWRCPTIKGSSLLCQEKDMEAMRGGVGGEGGLKPESEDPRRIIDRRDPAMKNNLDHDSRCDGRG